MSEDLPVMRRPFDVGESVVETESGMICIVVDIERDAFFSSTWKIKTKGNFKWYDSSNYRKLPEPMTYGEIKQQLDELKNAISDRDHAVRIAKLERAVAQNKAESDNKNRLYRNAIVAMNKSIGEIKIAEYFPKAQLIAIQETIDRFDSKIEAIHKRISSLDAKVRKQESSTIEVLDEHESALSRHNDVLNEICKHGGLDDYYGVGDVTYREKIRFLDERLARVEEVAASVPFDPPLPNGENIPLDLAWLKLVGFDHVRFKQTGDKTVPEYVSNGSGRLTLLFLPCGGFRFMFIHGQSQSCAIKTRRDFRDLCRIMGIELKG